MKHSPDIHHRRGLIHQTPCNIHLPTSTLLSETPLWTYNEGLNDAALKLGLKK